MYYSLLLYILVGGVIAKLDRAFQRIQTTHLSQTALDPFPAALHIGIDLTHTVFGTAALTVYKAFGTGSDGADATGQIQIALTALLAVVLQRGNTLKTGEGIGVAAGDYLLAGILLGNGLNANTAGEY